MAKKTAVVPVVKTASASKVTPLARTNAGVKPGSKVEAVHKPTGKVGASAKVPDNGLWDKSEDPISTMKLNQIADEEIRQVLADKVKEAFRLKRLVADAKLKLDGVKADPKKGKLKVEGLMEEITLIQKELGIKTLFVEDMAGTIENTFYRGTNVQLSISKLLENGVDATVIEKSKERKPYVTCVTKLKGEAE